jgi:hypothetical protein
LDKEIENEYIYTDINIISLKQSRVEEAVPISQKEWGLKKQRWYFYKKESFSMIEGSSA